MRTKLLPLLSIIPFFIPGYAFASIDPFHVETLTAPNPQTVSEKPLDLSIPESRNDLSEKELPKHPMSLIEITDFALGHNPNTWLAWAQAKVNAANVGIAESAYLPEIDAGGAVQYSAQVFSHDNNEQITYGPNISLSYVLLDFGQRSDNIHAALYSVIAANLSQNNSIQQVILQVEQAYYQVLGQQELVKAYQESLVEADRSLVASQALRANGLATIGDVYQAEGSQAQAVLNLQTAKGNYQTALGLLATTMGLPAKAKLGLLPLSPPTEQKKMDQSLDSMLEVAKRNRPDLLSAEAEVRQNQALLASTKASDLPVISLTGSATPSIANVGNGTSLVGTVSLSIPLFTGFSYTYQVKKAAAVVAVAQATRDQLDQQVQYQVWQAYFALQTATQNISTTEILLKSSEQASQQAMGQYKGGVGNILTVLTTQSTLAGARVQHIQAQLNWYLALSQLAASMGILK